MQATKAVIDGGGIAATAAAAATRLGISCRLAATLGDDVAGDLIINFTQQDGINTTLIVRKKGMSSPISQVTVNGKGLRSIAWQRNDLPAYKVDTELRMASEQAAMLLVDGHEMEAALELAKERRSQGKMNMLDAGTLREGMIELASYCQYVATSQRFATQLTDGDFDPIRALHKLWEMNVEYAVVTAGKDGCWYGIVNDAIYHQPAFPVDVVDTTGAGDVFHGAWCAAILKKLLWQEQIRYASAAAALSCCELGGRKGIPTWKELEMYLAEHVCIQPIEL